MDTLTGDEHNSNGKRTLPLFGAVEVAEKETKNTPKPIIPYTNKKLRSMVTDRQESGDK